MATTADILKKMRKDHGEESVTIGMQKYKDVVRLSTGIFALDLAMGGGFPMGRCSMVYGPESSNKTNVILKTIAIGQVVHPDKLAVFIDVEHALDLKWAAIMGVDVDRLIVVHPESAEQAVDAAESFLYATDVFCVALDSIAALTKTSEIEADAASGSYGGASIIVGRMYRKITVSQSKMHNAGIASPAFLAINQLRTKVGVTRGNDETMPGGWAPRFSNSMLVRVYGKNVDDKKIHSAMPAWKEVNCIIKKWKVPILATNAVYNMQMIPGLGREPGFVSDWTTLSAYMKELDYLSKGEKGGWLMAGNLFKTLEECRAVLYDDPVMLADYKATIIKEMLDGASIEPDGEIDPESFIPSEEAVEAEE